MATDTMSTDTTGTMATATTGTGPVLDDAAAQLRLNTGMQNALDGKIADALADYREALRLNPYLSINSATWNALCWNASLYDHAKDVVDGACENAVKLSPSDFRFRDSRGLARALSGRTADAIADFTAYAANAPDNARRAQRTQWINGLKSGQNPFTPATIATLRAQALTPRGKS
jgi:tetratricopeptide (TPR) repeat protein